MPLQFGPACAAAGACCWRRGPGAGCALLLSDCTPAALWLAMCAAAAAVGGIAGLQAAIDSPQLVKGVQIMNISLR